MSLSAKTILTSSCSIQSMTVALPQPQVATPPLQKNTSSLLHHHSSSTTSRDESSGLIHSARLVNSGSYSYAALSVSNILNVQTLSPGNRLGYFVANPVFIERLLRATEVETQAPSGWSQVFDSTICPSVILLILVARRFKSAAQLGHQWLHNLACQPERPVSHTPRLYGKQDVSHL
jgi:hypothetical protein